MGRLECKSRRDLCAEIDGLKAKVGVLECEADARRAEIDALETRHRCLAQLVHKIHETVTALSTPAEPDAKDKKIAELEREIATSETNLRNFKGGYADLKAQLESKELSLAQFRAQNHELKEWQKIHEGAQEQQDEKMENLKARAADCDSTIKVLTAECEKKSAKIADLKARLAQDINESGAYEAAYRKVFEQGKELEAQLRQARKLMREAIDNCETCRGESNESRRCARCITFMAFLSAQAPKPSVPDIAAKEKL